LFSPLKLASALEFIVLEGVASVSKQTSHRVQSICISIATSAFFREENQQVFNGITLLRASVQLYHQANQKYGIVSFVGMKKIMNMDELEIDYCASCFKKIEELHMCIDQVLHPKLSTGLDKA
jgi:hypothetical protein